jgi:hypothetical protein
MKIGRNDPCPCGSGKKYKKCCMLHNATTSTELHYRRLSEIYSTIFESLVMHAQHVLGIDGGKPALSEYFFLDPGTELEEEIHERQIGLYWPWMIFNWQPKLNISGQERGLTIAELYSEEKGHLLGDLDRKLIDAVNRRPYTFYEVLSVEPGKRIHLREVLTETEISVEERSGSLQLKPADLVFGRAVTVDGVGMIVGLSAYAIPPRYKPKLLELRREMRRKNPVNFDSITRWEAEIRKYYLEIDRALFSPPQLCNTDGDPLEFHKLVFDLDSAEDVFVKLASLCITETAEDLRRSAKKDADGHILRAEIFWSREGHKMSRAMGNTLLGNILIEPRRLTVTVNSGERAAVIRREIESRLDGARFRLDEIQDTRAMMEGSSARSAGARKGSEKNLLMQNPEVRRQLADIIHRQWEGWIDEKIPALGGRTPRRMVKTKEGRESVQALLADAERRMADPDTNDANIEGIRRVRELLGLKD